MNLLTRRRRAAAPTFSFHSTARSHLGLVRQLNEDRLIERPEIALWAVADGMGGHRGGDQAAQSVVDALRQVDAAADATAVDATAADAMLRALESANAAIHDRNLAVGEQAGATVVAITFANDTAHLAWAGDSRCYHIRGGLIRQLTHDHSVVQELVDAGLMTAAAAERHPQSNVVTRALGVRSRCEVETRTATVAAGDRFLLCSDGLSRSLLPEDLTDAPLEQLADALLNQALRRDGSDNISLVLIAAGALA